MTPLTNITGVSIDCCNLHRAESALVEATVQLRQFEARNGEPGMWTDELARLRQMTNRVVSVRDGMQTPQTLVRVGNLELVVREEGRSL